MVVIEQTFAVTPLGIGRRDYSQNVEVSVEPVIRSWETAYTYSVQAMLNPGVTVLDLQTRPVDRVWMLYDFFVSVPANVLLQLDAIAVPITGPEAAFLQEYDYQNIEKHLSRGMPIGKFLSGYRLEITNHSLGALLGVYTVHGVDMDLTRYQLSL